MKITIVGKELLVLSAITEVQMVRVQKAYPSALVLVNEETKEDIFAVGFKKVGTSYTSQFGITFGEVHEGKLYLALELKEGATAETVAADYGDVFDKLAAVEVQVANAITVLDASIARVAATIETIELA